MSRTKRQEFLLGLRAMLPTMMLPAVMISVLEETKYADVDAYGRTPLELIRSMVVLSELHELSEEGEVERLTALAAEQSDEPAPPIDDPEPPIESLRKGQRAALDAALDKLMVQFDWSSAAALEIDASDRHSEARADVDDLR